MLPRSFGSEIEIEKKLREICQAHHFENAQTICHIFYDVLKVCHYAVKRKIDGLRPYKKKKAKILLKRREITRVVALIDYHHSNDQCWNVKDQLGVCLGKWYKEGDALKFFESYVEGKVADKRGREILVDLEDGVKFMYKNPKTGGHEIKKEFYIPSRGKRLPWIKHTLQNTNNVYIHEDDKWREIMYINKYHQTLLYEEAQKCYWIVIVKKNRKDKIAPYKFKTAFPVFKYNSLLQRLERYQPI